MVASWASSREHIGPAAAPGEGGAGFTCARASTPNATAPSSTAQASSNLERERVNKSGITWLPLPASRGSVTSFPGHQYGGRGSSGIDSLALASNGHIFIATGMAAVFAGLGNRAGNFIRIDPAVGGGLGEIARPAIGLGGVGAAFVAL